MCTDCAISAANLLTLPVQQALSANPSLMRTQMATVLVWDSDRICYQSAGMLVSFCYLGNKRPVEFEIDTGAAVSVIGIENARKLFPGLTIHKTDLKLRSFCNQEIKSLGRIVVNVQCRNKQKSLDLVLTLEERQPLLGREWFNQLHDISEIAQVHQKCVSIHTVESIKDLQIAQLIANYEAALDYKSSKIIGLQAELQLKENAKPVFCKARSVPFKLLPLIDRELDRLCNEGILEKVNTSRWATPIVPVLKKNNQVRICGDFSVTLNPELIVDEHPLPTTDELFASMEGCTVFSKIDLQNAYLQLCVSEKDRELLTLTTHRGLFRSTRLMYGVSSSPAIWQRTIEQILQDLEGVVVFVDDIRVGGKNAEDHRRKLREVLERLQKHNVRINFDKSEFAKDKIQFCGYMIDKNGIHKCPEKMDAIRNMRRPQNVTELRSFLGLINYYGRFIENFSNIVFPLNGLLQKKQAFIWSDRCEYAFKRAKQAFLSEKCLVHFNAKLPLVLATDASPYGVGAVLSHTFPDGTEKVIQYASQTLPATQRKYSQIDKPR